jgi:hypothetical protein
MALTAKFDGSYKKRTNQNGQSVLLNVFRYHVNGTEEELKNFEEAQGDNYRTTDETNVPLFFTTNYVSDNVNLIITDKGNVVVDDSDITKIQSMVQTYGESVARLLLMKQS